MTGKPISLSRARKTRARDMKKRQADANAAKFGRTKAERAADEANAVRSGKLLEAHRSAPEDGT